MHASILDQVQHPKDSGQWRAFLEFARPVHHYGLNNRLLILAQNPHAIMVAGCRQWQTKGRQVHKREKTNKIFGYRGKKHAHTDWTLARRPTAAGSACGSVGQSHSHSTSPSASRRC